MKFNCNGLKLLLNELTGTGSDRTIPIVFRNDVNNKSIDLNSVMYRLTSSESATLFDRQAQKIIDIFSDAAGQGKKLTTSICVKNYVDDRIQDLNLGESYLKLSSDTSQTVTSDVVFNGIIK